MSRMFEHDIRIESESVELQNTSRAWWNQNPMSYDWHNTIQAEEGSAAFFDSIDRRFFFASPFYRGQRPFEQLIPFTELAGKRVLEIGCGLGAHTQLLAEAGCNLSSIDLTTRAVDLTRKRLALKGLTADVRVMDAEQLDFPENEFDFVWSWGVIHHSSDTELIVRRVAKALKPNGEFRFMVYNRHAFDSYVKIVRGLLTGKLIRNNIDQILSFYTDGYIARFYSRSSLTKLIENNGLVVDRISVLGQTSELLPLPGSGALGRFKYAMVDKIPKQVALSLLSSAGSFIFGFARKPS